jgi:hypothetical protein
LPCMMAAYRASKHDSTGFSPNFLTFGREVRAPVDLVLGRPEGQPASTDVDLFADALLERQQQAYDLVRNHLGIAAERAKKYYDAKAKPTAFKKGDWVWVYNPRRHVGRSPKWSCPYFGPQLIEKVLGPVNYIVRRSKRSKSQIVHVDKLKPYQGQIVHEPDQISVPPGVNKRKWY